MKTLTILSGKGGTGKTMLSSNLSVLLSQQNSIIVGDCDADTPNLGLVLGINNFETSERIKTNEKASLIKNKCNGCKKCLDVCNFGAIDWDEKNQKPMINQMLCEGCGACQVVCPKDAIKMEEIENASINTVQTKYKFPLLSGHLDIGTTGSGKVVNKIKEKIQQITTDQDYTILDSAAGVGCPVIASIQNSDYIIAIVEPSPSGISDLKRALSTADHFNIPYGMVINKHDINPEFTKKAEEFAKENNIEILGKIPYKKTIIESLTKLTTTIEYDTELKPIFKNILDNTISNIENQ